jgi:hypothetical protein
MPESLRTAKLYRDRAEELRAIATTWRNAETLDKLLQVARDYDQMAQELEKASESGGPRR